MFGHDLDRELEAAKACIGIVPQEINFNQFETPQTILVNQAGFYGIERAVAHERAEKYLKELQLWDKRDKMSRSLSGGMKRRLMIARALMNEPRLLILDEPKAGVDTEIRRSMGEFLRGINEQGTTIILTTHYLEEAETLCRNIAIIDGGRIAERDRMSSLLRKLHTEIFVLSLRNAVSSAVSGHCRNARPANATSPSRSDFACCIKSSAASFARASRFGAMGWVCRLSVVLGLKAFFDRARNPSARICRATRLRLAAKPACCRLRARRGLP